MSKSTTKTCGQDPWKKKRSRLGRLQRQFDGMSVEEKIACIPIDMEPTEFEVQAFLYQKLKDLGYVVRGEVVSKCGTCIFDLVVYIDGKPAYIIECKKRERFLGSALAKKQQTKNRSEQMNRYARFGVEVELVCGMSQAISFISQVHPANLALVL